MATVLDLNLQLVTWSLPLAIDAGMATGGKRLADTTMLSTSSTPDRCEVWGNVIFGIVQDHEVAQDSGSGISKPLGRIACHLGIFYGCPLIESRGDEQHGW